MGDAVFVGDFLKEAPPHPPRTFRTKVINVFFICALIQSIAPAAIWGPTTPNSFYFCFDLALVLPILICRALCSHKPLVGGDVLDAPKIVEFDPFSWLRKFLSLTMVLHNSKSLRCGASRTSPPTRFVRRRFTFSTPQ